jgi:hypothetical protein
MSDETKCATGEVMPNTSHSVPMVAGTHDLSGPAIFVKWRHEAAKKKMDAFAGYLQAAKGAVDAQAALDKAIDDAFEARQSALQRWRNMDDLLAIQDLDIKEELADRKRRMAYKEMQYREEMAEIEYKMIVAERRVEKLRMKKEAPIENDTRTPGERAMERVKALKKQYQVMTTDYIASCGGEDKLTEDDRDTLQRVELVLRDRINRELEELNDQ